VVYSSVTAVFQSLGKLGSAVSKLISGDFKGAWNDAKSSVTSFSKNFNDAKNRYEKGSNELTNTEKENAAKRAEALEKENERKKAAAEKAAQEAEKRRQAEKEAEEKRLQERKDYIAKQQEIEDEVQGAKDALIVKQEEDKQSRFLKDIEQNAAAQKKITDDAQAQENARTLIAKLNYEERIAYAQAAANTLSQLSELAGRETAAGKALGIASATINTYVGVSEALKQKSTLPSPFDVVAKVANVATVLATGFKAIKAITAVQVPNGGGGGGSPTPISVGGGSVASAPSFNVVGTSGQNQIAQTLGNQAPIKAFVVSNDVTTAQSLDRNIVQTATLGD
jgi:chemotaxis protein histidine kinase CheA